MPIAAQVQAYAGATAMVAVSTLVGLWIAPRWGTAPVDMIYLPAVLATAVLWGLGPAFEAGIAAALAYLVVNGKITMELGKQRCHDPQELERLISGVAGRGPDA